MTLLLAPRPLGPQLADLLVPPRPRTGGMLR